MNELPFHPQPKPKKKPKARSKLKKKPKKKKINKQERAKRNEFAPVVRKRIRERSGGYCELCKRKGILVEAREMHHVFFRSQGCRGMFTNGIDLCVPCHRQIEVWKRLDKKVKQEFSDKYGIYYHMDQKDIERYFTKNKQIDQGALEKWELYNQEKVESILYFREYMKKGEKQCK